MGYEWRESSEKNVTHPSPKMHAWVAFTGCKGCIPQHVQLFAQGLVRDNSADRSSCILRMPAPRLRAPTSLNIRFGADRAEIDVVENVDTKRVKVIAEAMEKHGLAVILADRAREHGMLPAVTPTQQDLGGELPGVSKEESAKNGVQKERMEAIRAGFTTESAELLRKSIGTLSALSSGLLQVEKAHGEDPCATEGEDKHMENDEGPVTEVTTITGVVTPSGSLSGETDDKDKVIASLRAQLAAAIRGRDEAEAYLASRCGRIARKLIDVERELDSVLAALAL